MLTFQKTFYFSATATPMPSAGGSASVSLANTEVSTVYSNTSATTTATFTATPAPTYSFIGWSQTESGAIVSTNNPYTATITSTSTNSASPTNTRLYARFQLRPAATGITADASSTLYVGATGTVNYTLTPTGAYDNVVGTSSNESVFTVTSVSGGVATIKALSKGTATLTLTARNTSNVAVGTPVTVTVTVTERCATPVITIGSSGATTITCATEGASIYYTTDGTTPTNASTPYTGSFPAANGAVVKAIAYKDGYAASDVASAENITTGVLGGIVTLDDREDHNWSYYQSASNLPTGYPTAYLSSPDPRNVKITYNGGSVSDGSAVAISALSGENQNSMVYYKTMEKTVPGMTGNYPYTVISNPFSKRPKVGTTYYGFAGWKVKSGGKYIQEYSDGAVLPLDATIHFTGLDTDYEPNCLSAEVVFEATWTAATVKTGNTAPTFSGGTYETNFWVLSSTNNIGDITIPANCTVSARYPDGTTNFTGNVTGTITAGGNNAKLEYVNMNSTRNVRADGYTFTMGRGIVNTGNGGQIIGCRSDKACIHTVKIESGKYASLRNFTNNISTGNAVDQLMILGCDYDRARAVTDATYNNKLEITGSMYVAEGNINLRRASGSLYVRTYIKSGNFISGVTVAGNTSYTGSGGIQTYYMSVGNSNTQNSGRRLLVMEGGHIRGIAGGMDESNNQVVGDRAFDLRVRGTAQIDGSVYGAAEFAGARGIRTMVFTGGKVEGWIAGGANGTHNDGGELYGNTYIYVGGSTQVGNSSGGNHVGGNVSYQVTTGGGWGGGTTTTYYGINGADGGSIFGAGCGINPTNSSYVPNGNYTTGTVGRVNNSTVVVADQSIVWRDVYGGGNFGYVRENGTTGIHILGGTVKGNVYGGSNNQQGQTVNILMKGGTVESGLYGGSNSWGTINNNVTMNINGGQLGADADHTANIHGGGYGNATNVNGNILVNIGEKGQTTAGAMIYGDVYGGSALGNVNDAISDSVAIGLYRGTIQGNVYGGGLGNNTYAAAVRGNVRVDVDGIAFVTTYDGTNASDGSPIPATGRIFGCNNNNGTPNGSVRINVYKTARADGAAHTRGEYEVQAVYGGGNLAAYTPTTNRATSVNVYGCGESSIEYVYGGGNAAPVPATDVNVYGSYEINYVFGGGNGKDDVNGAANPGADVGKRKDGTSYGSETVVGTANTEILGGVIHHVFGGSNTKGDVTKAAHVILGDQNLQFCEFKVDEVYGAGNEAYMSGDAEITMNCIEGLTAIYGGSRRADIGSPTERKNVVLNIYGGHFDQVFGGNNESGCIYGSITVNIQENGCLPIEIGELYLGGNQAPYSVYGYNTDKTPVTSGTALYGYPVLNVISATSIGSTYGGGLGATAKLYGNPHININMEQGSINGKYEYEEGKSDVRYKGKGYETAKTLDLGHLGTVYGGGNEAEVIGDTYIQVGTGTDAAGAALTRQDAQITGNVYGGGNHAEVRGKTNVVIGK
ncbi:MAG: chitobiase/beta-hexosaminidase C-terminal domain-containing protein [Bacteroidaceae bacterium]|nr:chitobiase/beta-hexosaminidase C-terminal domain-containing protein [Bacteroidaceae bacterium]